MKKQPPDYAVSDEWLERTEPLRRDLGWVGVLLCILSIVVTGALCGLILGWQIE